MSVSVNTIKHFLGKLGEKYNLQKKPETQHDSTPLTEESVNEVVQAVMTWENDPSTKDSSHSVVGEDDLMELFGQFAGWMSPVSGWLEPDTAVISEAFLQG